MIRSVSRLRNVIDALFLVGVVFALFLAGKVVPALVVFGVLPIPFLLRELGKRELRVSPSRLAAPIVAYFGYSLLVYFFYTGLQPGERRPINPDLELYGIALLMLAVGCLRGLQIDNLNAKFRRIVPHALSASFVVLSALMFLGYTDSCRVYAAAAWPFVPAVIFTTLTFLCLTDWPELTAWERRYRVGLVAADIVVVVLYTGSRGVAAAQATVLLVLLLSSFFGPFRGKLPNWRELMTAILASALFCGLAGYATGCDVPLRRLLNIARTAVILSDNERTKIDLQSVLVPAAQAQQTQTPNIEPSDKSAASQGAASASAPAAPVSEPATAAPENGKSAVMETDVSIGIRLEMWKASVQSIREAPIFGHGSLYLQHLIGEKYAKYGFEHNHNQYLSWLVTGGVVLLCLGLWLLLTPWSMASGLAINDRLVITLAVTVVWGVSIVFDSFLNMKFYLHYYCLLIGLLYALINDMLATPSGKKE